MALTDNLRRKTADDVLKERGIRMNMNAASEIFEGSIVYRDNTTGRAVITGATGNNRVAGIARNHVNNTGAITTDKPLFVVRGHLEEMTVGGTSASTEGDPVYAVIDDDANLTSASRSLVGFVYEHISGTLNYVKINPNTGV